MVEVDVELPEMAVTVKVADAVASDVRGVSDVRVREVSGGAEKFDGAGMGVSGSEGIGGRASIGDRKVADAAMGSDTVKVADDAAPVGVCGRARLGVSVGAGVGVGVVSVGVGHVCAAVVVVPVKTEECAGGEGEGDGSSTLSNMMEAVRVLSGG